MTIKLLQLLIENDDYIDCLGEFDRSDKICYTKCPVNIICIITRNRRKQPDIMEEMFANDTSFLRMH